MVYFSNKKKVEDILTKIIIPSLRKKDIDYDKLIQAIMSETLVSRNIIEDIIKTHIPNEIKEIHILTIPEEKIDGLLKELREEENSMLQDLKEAGLE